MPKQLFSKKGVEIFSVGKWNGDEYTLDDLNCIVTAFEETKNGSPPFLKLGHDPKQKLIQADGLPAAGWIDKLYVVGDKLKADFIDIPKKIYELIENRAYKKVSSEIFWNIKFGEKVYKRMLAAVALVGANTPGVSNLNDILAMYKIQDSECDELKVYNALEFTDSEQNTKGGFMPKTENELKLESELKETEDRLTAAEKLQAEKDAEIVTLKQFKIEAEAKEAKLVADANAAKIKAFVSELKAEQLCTPSMENMITELLGESKKEYTIKIQDKDEVMTKEQVLKEALKLFKEAAKVNFVESSAAGKKGGKESDDKELDDAAKKYMQEKNCTYGQALKEVMKQTKK